MHSKINEKRMLDTFVELVKIDSESLAEKNIALRLEKELKKLGAKTVFDNAHKKTGGNCGNLIARFPGTVKKPAFLLSSHMDTVKPGKGVKPKIGRTTVTSDGTTILGADCKSGITAILEVLRVLKENRLPHPPLEIAFTVSEEIGLLGSKNLDYSLLTAKEGLVLDSETPETITVKAPSTCMVKAAIRGLAAHAGMLPEEGISAIKVAAEAIHAMKLGRIDFETTANIGVISGGNARNIVPGEVHLLGEARSHNIKKLDRQTKHMRACLEKAVKRARLKVRGKLHQAQLDLQITREYPNLDVPATDACVKTIIAAGAKAGVKIKPVASGGGADSNVYFGHGIKALDIGCGMGKAHSLEEYLDIRAMTDCAKVALQVVVDRVE
ncbi:MAG: M20/M25/M40 family metallo-hydrolase [Elusimicrobiaceae bacterium]|nr:M20/M25/M40 family metallo-hydrolase [Elusimicrobiaceae bacterium]